MAKKTNDPINHPEHYTTGNMEVIDIMEDQSTTEEFDGYLKNCILKYILRYQRKNGFEDLQKAQWYLNKLMSMYE